MLAGTTSSDTGPTYDHTYGTDYGRYMYIEASSPRLSGDKARLISRPFTQHETTGDTYECLTFFYHMYGSAMGTLNIYKIEGDSVDTGNLGTPLWSLTGNQGNYWRIAQVRLLVFVYKLYEEIKI